MDYHIRNSHFSLVELSLLAHGFESDRIPSLGQDRPSKEVLTKTVLQMKATEKDGLLMVAIYQADPVGFIWAEANGQVNIWVAAEHKPHGLDLKLRSALAQKLLAGVAEETSSDSSGKLN